MSDTPRKGALRDAWGALPARWRTEARRWPRYRPLRWTPTIALIAVGGALLFAWGFLRIVLMLVFPRAAT
jgi:hypothetical protein